MDSSAPRAIAKPEFWESGPLAAVSPTTPRMKARWIVPPKPEGWDKYAISEWELTAAGFADHHPHDEVTFVLEGEVHIRVNGKTAIGAPGDTIRVPADSTGFYWAPVYARMLGVYGPNLGGEDSEYLKYWEIDDDAPSGAGAKTVEHPFESKLHREPALLATCRELRSGNQGRA